MLDSAFTAIVLASCGSEPPAVMTDETELDVYARVLTATLERLEPGGRPVPLHPYLAVARDTAGRVTYGLEEFEFESSETLRGLAAADTAVVLCRPDAQGACPGGHYLVLSQFTQLAERDAVVVAALVGRAGIRHLLLRLRYQRGEWRIAGMETP